MGAESTVKYTIEVAKTGEGASQAVADFKAVEAAAAKTNATMAQNTTAMTTATATTKTATASLKALQGTLTLVGLQTFPQLTLAATTAQQAFHGIKTAAEAAGVGMAAMGAQIAVISVGLYKIIEAYKEFMNMMGASKLDSKSIGDANESADKTRSSIREKIMQHISRGELHLSDAEASELDRLLEHDMFSQVRNMYQAKLPRSVLMTPDARMDEAKARLAGISREADYREVVRRYSDPNAGKIRNELDRSREMAVYQGQYRDQLAEIVKLQKEGMITQEQAYGFTREADVARMNSLTEIKYALTELQQLQGQVAQQFAAGFANAFVSFLDGTKSSKEAFTDFARQFLSQVSQMIMQQVVLNALRNVGFAGLAHGGVRFAADGLTGVQSVSSPTYFPKFNVVAGEAGKEMLTVLARPRMMEVGGMQAVVGSAQGNRLAITSADALAKSGGGAAGGTIVIQVQGTPDFEARVVSNSVRGAQVQVANDMRADTPISRGVKSLAS